MTDRIFTDRRDAGQALAKALPALDPDKTVVVALPRGGVPVAEQICLAHQLPLDLVFVRKIGVPGQPELAAGAIVDGPDPILVTNDRIATSMGLSQADIQTMGQKLLPEIDRRRALYLDGLTRPDLAGKTLVVVDDGVATGATLKASLQALRKRNPARIILALPVAPPDTLRALTALADQTICLMQPEPFWGVGGAYRDFAQTPDTEVVAIMRKCAAPGRSASH